MVEMKDVISEEIKDVWTDNDYYYLLPYKSYDTFDHTMYKIDKKTLIGEEMSLMDFMFGGIGEKCHKIDISEII